MNFLLNWLCISTLYLFSFSTFADELIIEPDMGRAPILNALNNTRYSVHLVMYGFTDETLLNSLLKQHESGRSIKVILEKTPYKAESENVKTQQSLSNAGIKWQGQIPGLRFIHQKALIIDGRSALIMTFNFTKSTFKNERNFALQIDDPTRIKEIENYFSADWNQQPIESNSRDLIWSPNNSRQKLISVINKAHHSIKIYAQSLSDYKINGELAKIARKGIQINILTSAKLREKQAEFLAHAGVNVRQDSKMYIHAKVIIIDNDTAVLGSTNLTKGSLDNNRELSVVTHDRHVINQLLQTFNQDWQTANAITIPWFDKTMQRNLMRAAKKLLHAMVN